MTNPERQPPEVGTIVDDPIHGYSVRFDQIGSDTEAGKLQFTAEPKASGPPAHIHPKCYERFEVLSGAIMLKMGRDQRVVEPGEKVSVPPGASHTWHNHTDQPAVVLVEMDPGLTFARFLDEWYELARDGRLNSKGDLGLLHTAVLFSPHVENGLMAVPGIPLRVQPSLMRTLSWLGRRLGVAE
jgi:quercetin dioxygenase-like cupin family protein